MTEQNSFYSKNNPQEAHSTDGMAIAQDYSMTFSPTGFMALLCKHSRANGYIEPEPVVKWGPADEPIIFWDNELVDARTLDIFRGLRKGRKIAAVVPGAGWSVECAELEDSYARSSAARGSTVPVVAWIVTDVGVAVPVIPSPHPAWPLRTDPADENIPLDSDARLIPPDKQ